LKRGELDGAGELAVRQLVAREEAQSAELDARVAPLVRKALKRGRFLET
jgi:hypothetical protein